MNVLYRNFFYSIGLNLILLVPVMNPETAQFKDLIALLNTSNFWGNVGTVTAALIVVDFILLAKFELPSINWFHRLSAHAISDGPCKTSAEYIESKIASPTATSAQAEVPESARVESMVPRRNLY